MSGQGFTPLPEWDDTWAIDAMHAIGPVAADVAEGDGTGSSWVDTGDDADWNGSASTFAATFDVSDEETRSGDMSGEEDEEAWLPPVGADPLDLFLHQATEADEEPEAPTVDDMILAGSQTTATVTEGSPASGTIDAQGDRDWFAVTLQAGTTYRFDLEGAATDQGTLYDPYLRLYDADGIAVARDDDGGQGLNARLTFTATEDGVYYVSAGSFADHSTGSYRIAVSQRATVDDVSDATTSMGVVGEDRPVSGEIDAEGDRDWFAVTLESGTTYRFDLEGTDTGEGNLDDPYLRLYDADGRQIAEDDDGGQGFNARLIFTAEADGVYYVAAGGYADTSTGTYRLGVVARSETDDGADGTASAGTLAEESPAVGTIDAAGDEDWFAVTLEGGATYAIDLRGAATGQGSLSDPSLRLYDAGGVQLAQDDDSGAGFDARLMFTASESGVYYVAAGAYADHETGTYRLEIARSAPDEDPVDVPLVGHSSATGFELI